MRQYIKYIYVNSKRFLVQNNMIIESSGQSVSQNDSLNISLIPITLPDFLKIYPNPFLILQTIDFDATIDNYDHIILTYTHCEIISLSVNDFEIFFY
jgi:hypothetical protein